MTAFVACVLAVLAAVTLVLTWGPDARWRDYLLGATHVGVVATCWHMLNAAFLAHDRLAILHLRGAWGEENTRDELKRAKRKKVVWDWVDSIDFQSGDLDHMIITRHGGLVALDSKWRSQVDTDSVEEMARAVRKAKTRAEGLAHTLLMSERGKRRARGRSVTVTPAVALWGAAAHDMPAEPVQRHGVHFVAGRQLVTWLATLDHDMVDRTAAQDLATRLKQFRDTSQQSG